VTVDPNIRRAEVADAAAVANVLRAVGWFAHINDEPPQATERRVAEQLALCADEREHTVLVAEDEAGSVVGYVATHWFPNLMKGMDGYISELFLYESARGQGIGAALLEAVKRVGRERGATRLMLFNRRERESFRRGFYPKHGWTEREDVGFFSLDLDDD
jgi:GNAT superfamily N-acetyltransferase